MKRTPLKRSTVPLRRTKLRLVGQSDTAKLKREIQALVRDIVIKRDGGCIFRNQPWHHCNGFANDGHLILQADHLVTRGNSATFADTRLIVCLCKGAHGWKSVGSNLRKDQYDVIVRKVLPPERVALWDMAEQTRFTPQKMDWKLVKLSLTQELLRTPAYIDLHTLTNRVR